MKTNINVLLGGVLTPFAYLSVNGQEFLDSVQPASNDCAELDYIFPLVIVLTFLFFGVFIYRILTANRIISRQNKNLSSQQKELEEARLKLESSLEEEQKIRKTLEETHHNLKSAQSQLIHAEKMSSLGQLTAGIAHEINNPVSFIKGGMQTLKMAIKDLYKVIGEYEGLDTSQPDLTENLKAVKANSNELMTEVKEMVEQLFKDVMFGTDRVTEIVSGLRIFSRHDEAKVKAASVHENLDAALLILRPKYKNRAEIIRQYDPSVQEIDCLPGQLNQVFVNLVSNAVDAMDEFGTLIISTQDLGNQVQLSFKDNGSGIPAEIKNKIFDPFFTTKEVGEGTGLGLSISHSIIEQHQGKLEVFSEEGFGTEFRITLPKLLVLESTENTESKVVELNQTSNKLFAKAQ